MHDRLLGWLLFCATLMAAIAACSEDAGAPTDRVAIQASWQSAREQPGHRVHVEGKQLPCDACHSLDGPREVAGFDRPAPDRCVRCHAPQGSIQHALGKAALEHGTGSPADCMDCHRFVDRTDGDMDAAKRHAERPQRAADAGAPVSATSEAWHCTECHGLGAGTESGLTTHRFADCARCHTPHGPTVAEPSPCTECHQDLSANHGAPGASVQHTCMTCHQQMHASKAAAKETCAECHAETTPSIPQTALFAGGHEACIDCHQPHDFRRDSTLACRSCHDLPAALAAARVAAHQPCGNCHDAHASGADPSGACRNCHQQLKNDHPNAPDIGECATCHVAHPSSKLELAHGGVLPCSDCHEQSVHDGVSHAVGINCTQCHRPHHFRRQKADPTLCRQCHERQASLTTTAPGHAQCVACHANDVHATHNPSRGCIECHSRQSFAMHPGHANCQSCHEPHSGSQSVPCKSCHTHQHATAPPGHRDCSRCHDGHSGARLPATECLDCHHQQARTLHHDIPGGCGNCHRAHGPSGPAEPPACTTCHQRSQLPGLHAVVEHGDCARCHSGHQKRVGFERENCLSCHEKQRSTHFPQAPRCSSCHLFQGL